MNIAVVRLPFKVHPNLPAVVGTNFINWCRIHSFFRQRDVADGFISIEHNERGWSRRFKLSFHRICINSKPNIRPEVAGAGRGVGAGGKHRFGSSLLKKNIAKP